MALNWVAKRQTNLDQKLSVIARRGFQLAYKDIAVQNVGDLSMGSLHHLLVEESF